MSNPERSGRDFAQGDPASDGELIPLQGRRAESANSSIFGGRRASLWTIPGALTLLALAALKLSLRSSAATSTEEPAANKALKEFVELAGTSDAAQAPLLCTDGWDFDFTFHLELPSTLGASEIPVLTSSTEAMSMKLKKDHLKLTITTYNYGDVEVSTEVEAEGKYDVKVEKNGEGLCLTLCDYNYKEDAASTGCVEQDPQCAWPPPIMPLTSFQMVDPGRLSWGSPSGVTTTGFKQQTGFIPVSMVVKDVPYRTLWESNSTSWDEIVVALKKTLAAAADDAGISPEFVSVTPAGPAKLSNGTMFVASLLDSRLSPCELEAKLIRDLTKKDFATTRFAKAASMNLKDLPGLLSQAVLERVRVPAKPMPCEAFGCRLSEEHEDLPDDALCRGGGCIDTCCQNAWSRLPVPYVEPVEHKVEPLDVPTLEELTPLGWATTPQEPSDEDLGAKNNEVPPNPFLNAQPSLHEHLTYKERLAKYKGHAPVPPSDDSHPPLKPQVNTDGFNITFFFDMKLEKGSCATPVNILSADFDAISLDIKPGKRSGTCDMDLDIPMLNPEPLDIGEKEIMHGCDITTSWSFADQGSYVVAIRKDMERCCMKVTKKRKHWHGDRDHHGHGGRDDIDDDGVEDYVDFDDIGQGPAKKILNSFKFCSRRDGRLKADHFVMRSVKHLELHSVPGKVQIEDFHQVEGGLSLSFDLTGFSKSEGKKNLKIFDHVRRAIKQAVAYSAGLGVKYNQVVVALKPTTTDEAFSQDREITVGLPPKKKKLSHDEEQLNLMLSGKGYIEDDVDGTEEERAEADEIAKVGPEIEEKGLKGRAREKFDKLLAGKEEEEEQEEGPDEGTESSLEMLERVHEAGELAEDRRLSPDPSNVLTLMVQVGLSRCGDCTSEQHELMHPSTKQNIIERVSAIPQKFFAAPLTGTDLQLPAALASCRRFRCDRYTVNRKEDKACFGSGCQSVCCDARTCSQITCEAPLINAPDTGVTQCSNSTDCAEKCCVQPCKDFKCDARTCPKENNWKRTSVPSESQETCCKHTARHCCKAPTAYCVGCMNCQSRHAYCASKLLKYMPEFGGFQHMRRLRSTRGESVDRPPTMLDDGGKTTVASASEIAADEADSLEGVQKTAERYRRLREGKETGEETKLRYRKLQESEHTKLLDNMIDMAKEAAAFRLKNMKKPTSEKRGAAMRRQWVDTWHKVVMDNEGKDHNETVRGCFQRPSPVCKYHFSSIFLLHRGCKRDAKSATTVKVLTDTRHAVSCGDDGLCWVWKIRSGTPRQVFFPNQQVPSLEPLWPVLSVSVLNDATYILSAGAGDGNHTTGAAYVWDWQYGFQFADYTADDGVILSTSEMAAWRLVLLGCKDSYTYIWQWPDSNTLKLPYFARTVEEIKDAIESNTFDYINNALDGFARLATDKFFMSEHTFLDRILAVHPEVEHSLEALTNIHDFFHKNRMGHVRDVVYVPTRMRFATAHADGKVRYWNADSGALLMVMNADCSPVNALAASPVRQEVVSGGDSGILILWSLPSGRKLLQMNQLAGGPIRSIAFVPGGNRIVVGSDDGVVRIWNVCHAQLICHFDVGGGRIRGVAVNPSNPLGQILVATEDGYVRVYDPNSQVDAIR